MKCDLCELEIHPSERPVRLSTSQPPWTVRSARGAAGAIMVASSSFSDLIRNARVAVGDEVDVELWFHRKCWTKFHALLKGDLSE